jgi:hypothetical protein
MYIPKHFGAKELIPRILYAKYLSRGEDWLISVLFDERLMKIIDYIRETFGPMTINDWEWGGRNQFRGFRGDCNVGAELSQHRFGRAVDMIPGNQATEMYTIRTDIINNPDIPAYADIGGIEMGVSWLHIDVRARNAGKINIFYP